MPTMAASKGATIRFRQQGTPARRLFGGWVLVSVLLSLLFASLSHAVFCHQCGAENDADATVCSVCGAALAGEQDQRSSLDRARLLMADERYDRATALLEVYHNRYRDPEADKLLARAYLGQCDVQVEAGQTGDKALIAKAYHIGQELMQFPDPVYFREGLFICARCLYFNDRPTRAQRYIRKAVKLSPQPPAEYLLAMAEIYVAKGKRSSAIEAYQQALAGAPSDEIKALVYYKLGIYYCQIGMGVEGRRALEAALALPIKAALSAKIEQRLARPDEIKSSRQPNDYR